MANYQWRAATTFKSDTSLSYGVTPSDKDTWQTDTIGSSQTGSYTYWYRDTNVAGPSGYTDANSSRVAISLTESWTTSVNDLNDLIVEVSMTLNSVVRDDLRGSNQNTPCRDINFYIDTSIPPFMSLQDCQLALAHTIYQGPMVLSTATITIPAGAGGEQSSLYVHNQTTGYSSYDDIWAGVQFKNVLPPPVDYIVTYDANGGTGAPSAQSHTTAQQSWTFTVPNTTPTWGQYRFLGWSHIQYSDSRTEADVEYRPGDTITLAYATSTLTLYAVWEMDYRAGSIYDGSVWQSHNRPTGTAHVYSGGIWNEMRTLGGPTAMGNPPSIYQSNGKWYNMNKTGKGED